MFKRSKDLHFKLFKYTF